MKKFLGFFFGINFLVSASAAEPFFTDKETAINSLDYIYSITTLGQRTWNGLSAVEILEDLQIWGEHFCEPHSQNNNTALAAQCFQLVEFYVEGGFGFDKTRAQTSQEELALLKGIASAVSYREYLSVPFFQPKCANTSDSIVEEQLNHISSMVAVAEAVHSPALTAPPNFSTVQTQWFEFLKIDHWLLHSELKDPKIISLDSFPTQSYIAYFGTPNPGVDRYQENNNGLLWMSNYYVSGGDNPNSSIREEESKGVALSVRYGSQDFTASSVETLYHLHKIVLAKKFKSLEEAKAFSELTPDKSQRACRAIVKKTDYEEEKTDNHMFLLLMEKYLKNTVLARAFLSVKHCLLFEGNKWKDPLWGMSFISPTEFSGANKLGKMLARVRKELMYQYSTNVPFRNFIEGRDNLYIPIASPHYPELLFE